jgi:hypothetical protein
MGEGWSDARAEYVFDTFLRLYTDSLLVRWSEQKSATGITDYDYVTNYKNGIRTHPYSTSTFVSFFSLLLTPPANVH